MTIVSIPQTIETECPICKKTVNAIKIENNIRAFLTNEDQFETTLRLFGCPECRLVFWSKYKDY